MQTYQHISEAERGGLLDLGKALRALLETGGIGGGSGLGIASVEQFRQGSSAPVALTPSVFFSANAAVTLIDEPQISVSFASGFNFLLTLGGNRILQNPSSQREGQSGVFIIQQDGTGGRTLTWGDNYQFAGGSVPTIPTTPHAWILVHYFVQSVGVVRCSVAGVSSSSLNAATVAEIRSGLETVKWITPSAFIDAAQVVTLTDAPTIDIDFGLGRNFRVTLQGDRVMGSPLDQRPGKGGEIIIKQDAVGGRTLTWHPHWFFPHGAPSLPPTPDSWISVRYFVEAVGRVTVSSFYLPAAISEYRAGQAADKFLAPATVFAGNAPIALIDSASIVPDFSLGLTFTVTLGGNRTMANPVNQKAGQAGIFYIQQDASGDRSLTWGSHYRFVGGAAPVIPTSSDAWTLVPYYVVASGNILCSAVEPSGSGQGVLPDVATVSDVRVGTHATRYISPAALAGAEATVTLTDGATVTPDFNSGGNFVLTLGGNRTLANALNQKAGHNGFFIIKQDGTGGRTLTWDTNYHFVGGSPTIPTAPGAWVIIPYVVESLGVIRCLRPDPSSIPTVANASEFRGGTLETKYIAPKTVVDGNAIVSLTDGANVSVNFQSGRNFSLTLGGDRTILNPSNQAAGQSGVFLIYQDATVGRNLTWDTNYHFSDGVPLLPQGAGQWAAIPYYVVAAGTIICASVSPGTGGGSPDIANASEFRLGDTSTKVLAPSVYYAAHAPVTLTDAETIAVDLSTGINFTVTLGGNRTLGNPTNQKVGKTGIFIIVQDATGSRTLTWDTNYVFPYGAPTLPTDANSFVIVNYYVHSSGIVRCWLAEDIANVPGTSPTTALEVRAGTVANKYISPAIFYEAFQPVALTDDVNISVDFAAGRNFTVTLAGDRTVQNPSNQVAGQSGFFIITQDSTGGRTLAWANNYVFPSGSPTIPTDPDDWTVIQYYVQSSGAVRCWPVEPSGAGGGGEAVPAASVSEVRIGSESAKYVSPATLAGSADPVTLIDAATIEPNFGAGVNFLLTLGGNRALENPTNQVIGRSGSISIRQDSTGGRTLTWGTAYKFTYGPPTLPSGANEWLEVRYFVEAADTILCSYAISPPAVLQEASAAEVRAGTVNNKYLSPLSFRDHYAPVTLTDAATIEVNLSLGRNFVVTLAGNRTIANPTFQAAGMHGKIIVRQDSTGGRTLTWGTAYKFVGNTPRIPTAANDSIEINYIVLSPGDIYCTVDDLFTLSTQPNNTATRIKFWVGTEANYNLLTPDPDTIYLTE